MLNSLTVMGRLTRDPELRYAGSNNTPVASFSIACERDFKGADGEKVTDFFDCVAWRNTAEFVSKYFTKGRMIVLDGRLQSRKWEDKDGNKRVSVEIVAENVYFGDSKKDGETQAAVPASVPKPATSNGVSVDFEELDEADGELPF